MKIKIKNLLPKGKGYDHLNVSGKNTLTKDSDFDILCVKIDFDGCFNAFIRLWAVRLQEISLTLNPPHSIES